MYKHQSSRIWYNGRLEADQEQRLLRHEQFLVDNLQCDQLLDVEVTEKVFNVYDRNALKYALDTTDKNTKLLNILLGKTPQGFHAFMHGLLQTGQIEAYRRLCLSEESSMSTGEVAVQTEAGEMNNVPTPSESPDTSPADLPFPLTSLVKEQKDQQRKITSIEDRVDRLADSVQDLTTAFRESNQTALEAEQRRDARVEELQRSLDTREALLLNASRQIDDLRCKIEEVERQKSQALGEANRTIEQMSQEIAELSKEKERLEAKVRSLTSDNERLRAAIEQIIAEKEQVQIQLNIQAKELTAVKACNEKLEEKLSQNEQKLQFVVSKVNKIEMRVESGRPRAKKARTSLPRRGRCASILMSSPEEPTSAPNTSTVPKSPEETLRKLPLEPMKQSVAKPNSKKL